MPELKGKLDGPSIRVPTANVSVIDFKFTTKKPVTVEAVNAAVKKAAETVGGISAKDFDARFNAMLELVKADVAQGSQLKITGTPTFFVNGMRLPGLRGEFFDAAIAWELRRVQAGK